MSYSFLKNFKLRYLFLIFLCISILTFISIVLIGKYFPQYRFHFLQGFETYFVTFLYMVTVGWIYHNIRKNHISAKSFFGTVDSRASVFTGIGYEILHLLISISSTSLIFYAFAVHFPAFYNSIQDTESSITSGNIFHDILLLVLLAPIVEEIIFRGILLEKFSKRFSIVISILLSSILFGILHADIVGATFFGIFMSILRIRSGSLLLPMCIHAANNLIPTLLVYILPDLNKPEYAEELLQNTTQFDLTLYTLISIASIGISIFLIVNFFRKYKKNAL